MGFEAVLFDWRGTLVTTLSERDWVRHALAAAGMTPDDAPAVLLAIAEANGPDDRLDGPGVDSDADAHRRAFMGVFADANLPDELAEALYALEADAAHNPFADDVQDTLHSLKAARLRIAVVSDIHFDLRPVFAAAALLDCVDAFTLSFEQGIQKPNPLMFTRTAEVLGVRPSDCLMVGDRSGSDGPAVEVGMTTLLLPPLRDVGARRLHHVLSLCGVAQPAP